MAVTLTNTGVTFSDSTSQNTKGATLSAVQYSGYFATAIGGTTWPTSPAPGAMIWFPNYGPSGAPTSMGDAQSTVFCGWDIYRYGTYNNPQYSGDASLDSTSADAQNLYIRAVYRTIS